MKIPLKGVIAATVLGLTLPTLFMAGSGPASAAEKKLWADSFLGKKAPELVTEKWLGNQPETKGKWVLVDFWATWCGPCRAAIPELNTFHEKFKDKLVVIGISDEPEEKVREMKSPEIKYHSAIDTQARTKKALNVKGIPHVIVIDPEGIVRWEGFPMLEGHELTTEVMEKLLGSTASAPAAEKKAEPAATDKPK